MSTTKKEKPEYLKRGRTNWLVLPDSEGAPLELKKGNHRKEEIDTEKSLVSDSKTPQLRFRARYVAGDRRR